VGSDKSFLVDWRFLLISCFVVGSLIVVFLLSPIPQDVSYHDFADYRSFIDVPNALNVISNLPFLIVGVLGLRTIGLINQGHSQIAWAVFFVGVLLVSVGSAYYHLAPNNDSLVWDRLPMTIGFMGLFVALVSEFYDQQFGIGSLVVAVLFGVGSVAYWKYTDDLRFYAWVQFMPLGVITLLLSVYRARFTYSWLLGLSLGCYVLAKISEHFDIELFQFSQHFLSGHTIKHLVAAFGCYVLVLLLQKRRFWHLKCRFCPMK
jgi:hypothetical protein